MHCESPIIRRLSRKIWVGSVPVGGDAPIAVLNHNRPAAYLLSARAYEALLDRLDDAELTRLVKQRQGDKRVKVSLEDL